MRALTLDFRRHYRPRWPGLALLLVGMAGAAAIGLEYRQIVTETAMAEAGLREQGLAARRKTFAPVTGGDIQRVALELKHAREVVHQLRMPWEELFRSLEAANASTVALLGIESDTDRQHINITAEAEDLDAMLNYLRELESRSVFADVYLHSHQIQQQDPQRPVRFVLSATWLVRE